MINDDTIRILKECNAGVKMAVSSFDDVIDRVENETMKNILIQSKQEHEKLGDKTREILNANNYSGKNPNPMAQGMSWMKTNVELIMNKSDNMIADIITDGCNMGIKSLNRYLNQYVEADENSKNIAKELIDLEEKLTIDLRKYL